MSSLIVLDKQPQSFQFSRLNAMVFFFCSLQKARLMADESIASFYGGNDSTKLINEDEQETRARREDSFYNDQPIGTKDQRTLLSADEENRESVENNEKEKEGKPSDESSLSISNSEKQYIHSEEKSQRPTSLSFSNDHATGQSRHGAVTPSRRQVSFIREANQNESCDASVAFDNSQLSSDSLSRVRAITSGSVYYRTHSEAEECDENELSCYRSNSQMRRRRRYTKRGAVVSDSFVNECICCCVIV